jgi:anti-sigma factor RsiW
MSCEWSARLDRYLDGELPGSELQELEAHLRGCPSCAAGALSRLQMKRMNQAAGQRFFPRPEFRLKIEQSVSPKPRSRWAAGWVPAFAAAALGDKLSAEEGRRRKSSAGSSGGGD